MKLDRELSGAIRTIEMMLDKLSAKEEFCVSDIEADLVEWIQLNVLYASQHCQRELKKDNIDAIILI